MHLIDAFSLNAAHEKLVKLVCHWNAPLSPLLDPVPLSVNHHLPEAAETFPHINKAIVCILKLKPLLSQPERESFFICGSFSKPY